MKEDKGSKQYKTSRNKEHEVSTVEIEVLQNFDDKAEKYFGYFLYPARYQP